MSKRVNASTAEWLVKTFGDEALVKACANNNLPLIKDLLKAGVNPNAISNGVHREPAIMYVLDNEKALRAIVEAGYNINEVTDDNGNTVLARRLRDHVPNSIKQLALVKYLLEKGANPNIEVRTKFAGQRISDRSLIVYLLEHYQLPVNYEQGGVNKLIALLLDHGLDINYGRQSVLVEETSLAAFKQLLNLKPDLNKYDEQGLTPLLKLCTELNTTTDAKRKALLLIAAGCDVNKQVSRLWPSWEGYTALYLLLTRYDGFCNEIIEKLLTTDVDPNVKTSDGKHSYIYFAGKA